MTPQSIALIAGLLFLLIAVVGGGFRIERLEIPKVPTWGRISSFLLGLVLLAFSTYVGFGAPPFADTDQPQETTSSLQPPAEPSGKENILRSDSEPDTTIDGLQLSNLMVTSDNDPLVLNDRVTVRFFLKNVSDDAITLGSTFVAARDPSGSNADFPEANFDTVLAPKEQLKVEGSRVFDMRGKWQIWPCYTIGESSCPDEWRSFEISVQ